MRTRHVMALVSLACLVLAALPASTAYMPVEAIKPGMIGIGKTVFEGTRIDEFKVVVLGVLRNVAAPRRTLILARLEGAPLATTGVLAGMSGSPVYLEGKLAGAIAYSLGSFSKEPIAGITPIAEILAAAEARTGRLVAPNAGWILPVTRDEVLAVLRRALPRLQPFAAREDDVRLLGPAGSAGVDPGVGVELRPIDTPLVLAGFSDEGRREIAEMFRPGGFLPTAGVADPAATTAPPPAAGAPALQPGDSVGVDLITGDLALGATGTVTEVAGTRVYALGHSLYNLGPTRFPMTRAYVHALLPSLLTSTKIATTGEIIGTFRQDRATGIAGTLDEGPSTIPLTIAVGRGTGAPQTFRMSLARDEALTPLLAYTALANVLLSYERSQGTATVALKGSAAVRGHGPVVYDDVFIEETPALVASAAVAAPLVALMNNEFESLDIDAIDLQVTVSEQQRRANIERAWLDTDRPKAGQTVGLKVTLRGYRGDEETRTLPIEIPARATGTLTLLVADASRLSQWEQREARPPQPSTVEQMLRTINRARRGNRLYVRLIGSAPGAVVKGEQFPALPPSILAVYEADRNSGSFSPLRYAVLGEWEVATAGAVAGSRQLTFSVDPER